MFVLKDPIPMVFMPRFPWKTPSPWSSDPVSLGRPHPTDLHVVFPLEETIHRVFTNHFPWKTSPSWPSSPLSLRRPHPHGLHAPFPSEDLIPKIFTPRFPRKMPHPRDVALASAHGLQHGLVQPQFEAGFIEHLPLVGIPRDEAVDLHRLALPDPVTPRLSLEEGRRGRVGIRSGRRQRDAKPVAVGRSRPLPGGRFGDSNRNRR